jgi:hypothetical protein
MVMSNFDDVELRLFELFDAALEESPCPPPHVEELDDSNTDSGVSPEIVSMWRRRLQAQMTAGFEFGSLLQLRREAMGYSVASVCAQAQWQPDRLIDLEANRLDINDIQASSVAMLLRALGITQVGPIDAPVRTYIQKLPFVRQIDQVPICGHADHSVSVVNLPAPPSSDAERIDHEATARVADRYLNDLREALSALDDVATG